MESISLSPTVKFNDAFVLSHHLVSFAGLYDNYQIHLYKDETNVTILTCNHLLLVTKLAYLDFTQYHHVYVYGSTSGIDDPHHYKLLLSIFQRYRKSHNREQMIKIYI